MTNAAQDDKLHHIFMKASIIIPAYNEEERLPAFLDSVLQYEESRSHEISEILVVDDGSSDGTADIVRANSHQKLRLISLPQNQGKGAAVKRGVEESAGDVVVFIDADGATPITELPHMLSALEQADVAVGNRWMSGAHVHKSTLLRHVAGWIYKTYMGLFGLAGIDTMCGFKGYKREVAKDLFSHLLEPRWLFDTEIAYKAVTRGYEIRNFPIEWESKPGSKLSTRDLIQSGLQILPLIMRIRKQSSGT